VNGRKPTHGNFARKRKLGKEATRLERENRIFQLWEEREEVRKKRFWEEVEE